MNPLIRYGRHLRIEVLLAIAAYAVALRAFELGIVLGGLVLASGYVADGPRGRRLPRRVGTIVAVVIAGWLVLSFAQRPDPEETMATVGRLACLLAVLRLYERRLPRDDRQIIALAVVAVVASILYSFQLLFGLIVLVFAVQTIHVLMLNRLQSGLDIARRARRGLEAETVVPPVEAGTGRAPILEFRLLVGICALLAFTVATGVFFVFPRKGGQLAQTLGTRTGFSPDVDLDRNDRIEQSNREVLTVQWLDPQGEAVEWPQPLLLRGAVLDRWDPAQRRWRVRDRGRSRRRLETTGGLLDWTPLGAASGNRGVYTQVVVPRALTSTRLFARWVPVALSSEQPLAAVFDPVTFEVEVAETGRPNEGPYAFEVIPSPSEEIVAALGSGRSPPIRRVGFPVPEVREEAERILRERDPTLLESVEPVGSEDWWRRRREIAQAFTDYLQGPDFRYTLDLRRVVLRDDVDPIVGFLRDHRFGHCEYFASAMCALCQSMGVEARMVTGYVAVEYDANLRQYVVRESNAHAWVEVRTGPWTWREFDPTSADVLEALQADRRSWADDWRWLYDRFETFWTMRFVAFDSDDQSRLAEGFGEAVGQRTRSALDGVAAFAARVNRYFRLGPAGYIWLGVMVVVFVTAFLVVVKVVRRRRRIRAAVGSTSGRIARELGFYLDLLDAFELIGRPKPAHRAPLTHLRDVATVRPDIAAAATPLIELFYEVRFGGRRLDAEARRRAEIAAEAVRTAAREPAP